MSATSLALQDDRPLTFDRLWNGSQFGARQQRAAARRHDATILVIEDDLDTNRFVASTLRGQGLSVLSARDGREGIRLAVARHPDVMLLDILLPDIDGFGVLQYLSDVPEIRRCPIVVMTGIDDKTAERTALQWRNVLRVVHKPVEAFELSAIVTEILDLPSLG